MKISEVMQPAKVTKVMPNQSAEVDHGDGTKTVVDLKKNPQALAKDPESGKVTLNKQPKKPGQSTMSKQDMSVKPGDKVEIDNEATLSPTAQLFKGVHIEVRPNKVGGFDIISDNSPAAATVVKSFDNVEDANKYAKMLDDNDMKALSSMPPSIRVQDDRELESMRRIAGLR
jgi:hypothetical protein